MTDADENDAQHLPLAPLDGHGQATYQSSSDAQRNTVPVMATAAAACACAVIALAGAVIATNTIVKKYRHEANPAPAWFRNFGLSTDGHDDFPGSSL